MASLVNNAIPSLLKRHYNGDKLLIENSGLLEHVQLARDGAQVTCPRRSRLFTKLIY